MELLGGHLIVPEPQGSYARAQVADYWIVNLADAVLEVYREPEADAAAAFGWRNRSVAVLSRGQEVSPLARPGARVAAADLLL